MTHTDASDPNSNPPPEAPATAARPFRRRHRLAHAREFQAVYRARIKKVRGPLIVFGLPNHRPEPRLGLAVGRHVGPAVTRNRIKRMIREAFRLDLPDLPAGFDFIVRIRPHAPLPLAAYRRLLTALTHQVAAESARRSRGTPDA